MCKKIGLGLFLGLLLLMFAGGPLLAATYTFDSDNQGWVRRGIVKVAGSPDYENVSAASSAPWYNDGGNGCLRVTAHYFNYPPYTSHSYNPRPYNTAVFDDFGDLTGMALQADFKRTGNDFSTLAGSAPTIRWVISDTDNAAYGTGSWYVSKVGVSPQLNSLTGSWQTLSINLDANNFFLWPNGNTTNPQTFDEVLQQGDIYVGISLFSSAADDSAYGYDTSNSQLYTLPDYGASSSGDLSYLYIDNFTAAPVPLPGAAWLLFSGLLGLLGVRKKRS